jgi:hypothetical protein
MELEPFFAAVSPEPAIRPSSWSKLRMTLATFEAAEFLRRRTSRTWSGPLLITLSASVDVGGCGATRRLPKRLLLETEGDSPGAAMVFGEPSIAAGSADEERAFAGADAVDLAS